MLISLLAEWGLESTCAHVRVCVCMHVHNASSISSQNHHMRQVLLLSPGTYISQVLKYLCHDYVPDTVLSGTPILPESTRHQNGEIEDRKVEIQ